MTTKKLTMLALLCALPLAAGAAEVYRWVDKDGKVHYTSQKPPDAKAEQLPIKSAPSLGGTQAAAAAPATAPAAAPPTTAPLGDAEAANASMKKEVEALNAQRCNTAKKIAATYDSAPFLEKANADGTKSRLAPEEEAAERARMKNQVASACAIGGG